MALLGKQDLVDIEAAIGRAESRSAGELVVAVVERSDDYALPRALCACAWTVALAVLAVVSRPQWPAVWVILAQLPVAVLVWNLWGVRPLLGLLLARKDVAERVRRRALQMFVERGVHHTRDQSGLLILISELERHVVIFGDRGIHAHVGTGGWEGYVAQIVEGVHTKRLKVVLVDVIDHLGAVLAEKFPARPDDTNELPNHVVLQ